MRHMTFLKVFQLGKMNHVTVKKFNEGSVANETQWNSKILPGKAASELLLSQEHMHW